LKLSFLPPRKHTASPLAKLSDVVCRDALSTVEKLFWTVGHIIQSVSVTPVLRDANRGYVIERSQGDRTVELLTCPYQLPCSS